MDIGTKIKELRLQNNLTQEELADRCELTKGYISQLENDLTSPSITTLVDLLSALGTSPKEFFADDDDQRVVFKEEDFIEKVTDDYILNWLVPNAQKNEMEPIRVELKPGKQTEVDVPHEGEEFGYVLEGQIEIHKGKKKYICKIGESFYFESNKEHYIINCGKKTAKFIWVSSPPTF